MRALLVHPASSEIKDVPLGYSWTTLIFWFGPALFRADYGHALIILIIGLIPVIGWVIALLVIPFVYNKAYANELIRKGWRPIDDRSASALRYKGIEFPEGDIEFEGDEFLKLNKNIIKKSTNPNTGELLEAEQGPHIDKIKLPEDGWK